MRRHSVVVVLGVQSFVFTERLEHFTRWNLSPGFFFRRLARRFLLGCALRSFLLLLGFVLARNFFLQLVRVVKLPQRTALLVVELHAELW